MNRFPTLCLAGLVSFALALPALAQAAPRTPVKHHPHNSLEDEITAVVEQFHAASTAGNLNGIERFISDSPNTFFLGSDATEIFIGHDDIVQWWADLFAFFQGLGYPNNGGIKVISDGELLHVRKVGDLVLAADEALWRFNGGDITFRLTLVLKKEGGRWKILQGHFSNPLANGQLPL
jgi:ketosteroid isomerase-like protein